MLLLKHLVRMTFEFYVHVRILWACMCVQVQVLLHVKLVSLFHNNSLWPLNHSHVTCQGPWKFVWRMRVLPFPVIFVRPPPFFVPCTSPSETTPLLKVETPFSFGVLCSFQVWRKLPSRLTRESHHEQARKRFGPSADAGALQPCPRRHGISGSGRGVYCHRSHAYSALGGRRHRVGYLRVQERSV